jgi:hypothetical protein
MKKLCSWEGIKDVTATLFLFSFIVYGCVVAYWLLYPYEPITVSCIKILNQDKTVKAGEHLIYKIEYKKNMDVVGILNRKLVNDVKIDLSDQYATASIGTGKDVVYIRIPHYADTGTYYLWWSARYQVNPIREIVVNKKSEVFTIIRAVEPGKQGAQGKQGIQGKKGDTGGVVIFGGKK